MSFPTATKAYWKLDESSGNATDYFNGLVLTNNGTSTYSSGKINNGVVFNGSSQYLKNSSFFNLSTSAFAVSFWFKTTTTTAARMVSYAIDSGSGATRDFFDINIKADGKVNAEIGDAGQTGSNLDISSTASFNDGIWHHIAVISSNTTNNTLTIYVDNSSVATATGSGVYNIADRAWYLGVTRNYSTGNLEGYFNGSIDEIAFYQRAITVADVSTLYNLGMGLQPTAASDLISYYKLEDTSDSVGSNTLTNNGSVSFATDGKIGKCATFNGTSQYFSKTPLGLSNTTFSISGWFNLGTDKRGSIYQEGISGNNSPYIQIARGGVTGEYWSLVARNASETGLVDEWIADITRNVWHHFVWTMTTTQSNLYLDGNTTPIRTTNFTANSFTANVARIGSTKRVNEESYFGGSIDELGIWSRALTADEISQLYNSKRALAYPLTAPTLYGGVAYYKMDSGALTTDSIGSNTLTNDSVVEGTAKLGTASADLESGSTAVFTTTTTPVTGTGDKTISCWVNPESFNANGNLAICIGGQATNAQISLGFVESGKPNCSLYGGGGAAKGSVVTTGSWYHLVAVCKTSGILLYVNGSLVATGAANSMNVSGTNGNIFGNYTDYDANWGYDGLLDEVSIFNRALSSTEVTELYNSGNGKQYPWATTYPGFFFFF